MNTTYKEIETGVMQRTDVDGETTTSYMPFKQGDTRTDIDDEENETVVDLWQEALDAGAVLLSDEDKAATLAEQAAQLAKVEASAAKLSGVEFEGVMCSATAEDQHGLADIEAVVRAGMAINFHFENGAKLVLTTDNIDAFRAVWFPFRLSFFQ